MTGNNNRLIEKQNATEVRSGNVTVWDYLGQTMPAVGVAMALIEGAHPPETDTWLQNREVDEVYVVVSGSGTLSFETGDPLALTLDVVAIIQRGSRYRIDEAEALYLVTVTSPAWTAEQHETVTP